MEKEYRYRALSQEIEHKILRGIYHAGEKLPSIRTLHRRLNLSISTVYKAFIELETMGLIEARPKSGYYVAPVTLGRIKAPDFKSWGHPPQKVQLSSMINSVVSALNNPALLPLGSTVVDASLLPIKKLAGFMKGISHKKMLSLLNYSLSEGEAELRRHISQRAIGVADEPAVEDIIITNGCTEAVSLAILATTRPGDIIAIESPTNFSFLQLLKELGRHVLEVPTDPREGVDPDELRRCLQRNRIKTCLFMPNFHNPLGALMPDDKKAAVVDLLNRQNIPVIEDDISAELYFEGQRPKPLKFFDRKDLVLTCSSFSKTLAPGLRTGWIVPGRRFKAKIQRLKAGTSISNSTLDQYLVSSFLSSGAYDRHLRSLRNSLKRQAIKTVLAVQKHFPPDTRMALPRGGSLLWVQLAPEIDGVDLYRRALDHNISIIPGAVCSNSPRFDNTIQISYGLPYTPEVEKGVATLGEIIRERLKAKGQKAPGESAWQTGRIKGC
jgi:DNA-binding transcriptional MocR family regulator